MNMNIKTFITVIYFIVKPHAKYQLKADLVKSDWFFLISSFISTRFNPHRFVTQIFDKET